MESTLETLKRFAEFLGTQAKEVVDRDGKYAITLFGGAYTLLFDEDGELSAIINDTDMIEEHNKRVTK